MANEQIITKSFIDSFDGQWRPMTNNEYGEMVVWITRTEWPAKPVIADWEGDKWVIKDEDYARVVAKDNSQVPLDECSCVSGKIT